MEHARKRSLADDIDSQTPAKTLRLQHNEAIDHLALLHDDCLLDILGRLHHNDLDETSMLSGRMDTLSTMSRAKAGPVRNGLLTVCRVSPREFQIVVAHRGQVSIHDMDLTDGGRSEYEKRSNQWRSVRDENECTRFNDSPPLTQEISDEVIAQAETLLSRCQFKYFVFQSISIDDNFLSYFERIASSPNLRSIELINAVFDPNIRGNGRERLLSLFLSAKPQYLSVDMVCEPQLFDETFLREFVEAVPLCCLKSFSKQDELSIVLPNAQSAEFLSNVHTIEMGKLVVETDCKRLNIGYGGKWDINLTRSLEEADISAFVEATPGLMYHSTDRYHYIEQAGSDIKLKIRKPKPWRKKFFTAAFVSSVEEEDENVEEELTPNEKALEALYEIQERFNNMMNKVNQRKIPSHTPRTLTKPPFPDAVWILLLWLILAAIIVFIV